jgi:hypothetical protein
MQAPRQMFNMLVCPSAETLFSQRMPKMLNIVQNLYFLLIYISIIFLESAMLYSNSKNKEV